MATLGVKGLMRQSVGRGRACDRPVWAGRAHSTTGGRQCATYWQIIDDERSQ